MKKTAHTSHSSHSETVKREEEKRKGGSLKLLEIGTFTEKPVTLSWVN